MSIFLATQQMHTGTHRWWQALQATFCIAIGKGVKTAVYINLFNDVMFLAGLNCWEKLFKECSIDIFTMD